MPGILIFGYDGDHTYFLCQNSIMITVDDKIYEEAITLDNFPEYSMKSGHGNDSSEVELSLERHYKISETTYQEMEEILNGEWADKFINSLKNRIEMKNFFSEYKKIGDEDRIFYFHSHFRIFFVKKPSEEEWKILISIQERKYQKNMEKEFVQANTGLIDILSQPDYPDFREEEIGLWEDCIDELEFVTSTDQEEEKWFQKHKVLLLTSE